MTPSPKNPRLYSGRTRPAALGTSVAALLALCFIPRPASAQTWEGQVGVTSGDWNTATNWDSGIVPNSPSATAIFGTFLNTTNVSLSTSVQVNEIIFNVVATDSFSFTNNASLTLSGAGINNVSGGFSEYFENVGGATISFTNGSNAGLFTVFTNDGASSTGGGTGAISFGGTSNAGGATVINLGGAVSGAAGGTTIFGSSSSAGTSTIVNNGGLSSGGATFFEQTASGGTASAVTNGNGVFDISGLTNAGMNIGSIAGSGTYFLGGKTLTIGGNNATTAVSGTIVDGGRFGGTRSSLVKTGTGTLTLAGTNTYTGTTAINGGILQVNGALQSTAAVTVNSGGTLAGTGTLAGPVTVNSGGVLAHSNSSTPGTITVGGLTLNSGSKVDYELGMPGTAGGGVNDLTVVNGNLALGGTLNLTELSGFGAGTYELFSYTGTLAGSTMSLGTLPAGFTASEFSIQTSVAHEVNLVVSGGPTVQYWDGAITKANSAVNGGSGTWSGGTTNWTNVTGSTNASWGQSVAIFSTSSGTVTVASNITAGELRFTAGAGAYAFNINSNETLSITGAGITNSSATAPTFTMAVDSGGGSGSIHFTNAATAGNANITTPGANGIELGGGFLQFANTSSAGTATITNSAGNIEDGGGGTTTFLNGSTAGQAMITNQAGGAPLDTDPDDVIFAGNGQTVFSNTSSAGTATIINNASGVGMSVGGATTFSDNATAANAHITNHGGVDSTSMGSTLFSGNATAGNAVINNIGTTAVSGLGGVLSFGNNSTAGNATIINGGSGPGAAVGGSTQFFGSSTAGNALIEVQGGTGGGPGGAVYFEQNADGGTARVVTTGNGTFDISGLASSGMNIGSISGSGTFFLGGKTLTVGGNNLSTTVSGSINDFGGQFGGGVVGGGSLVKVGTGTLTLSGTNIYFGTTTVSGGGLQVDGLVEDSFQVTVNTGGTLGGTGTINGPVVVNSGGTLTHEVSGSAATLTIGSATIAGSLTLGSGSTVDYQLGTPGTPGGGVNDLTAINGNLTLGGTLNISALSGFGTGIYELFSYTGTFQGGTLSLGAVPTGFVAQNFTIQTSVANEVNLIVTGPLYWNGTVTTADGTVHGGAGNWDNATTNWTDATGATSSSWQGINGIFSGTSGTVTLTQNVPFAALEFSTSGYVITASGGVGLNVNGGATIATDAGANTTIDAPIQGSGNLLISGSATLTLSGTLTDAGMPLALTHNSSGTTILTNTGNTYSGPTTVNSGVLQIGTVTAAGSDGAGAVGVNSGGTLSIVNLGGIAASDTFSNNISNGVGGVGTVNVNSANTNILAGTLTDGAAGTLALTQSGSGTTILTNTGNTYSGATTVDGGTLQIGIPFVAGSIGANSVVSVGSGSMLTLVKVNGNTFSNGVSGGGTLEFSSASPLTISGKLTGQLAVIENGGTGILTNGTNNFSGTTTVADSGNLQIGTAANTGSIGLGSVTATFGGTFTVVNPAGGALTNSFSNGFPGIGTTNFGTIVVNSTKNVDFLGALTDGAAGKLAFVQSGSGITTLSNSGSTYSGGTTVNGGILEVTNLSGSATGTGTVTVNGGTLTGTGSIGGNVTLAGGSLVPGSIPFAGTLSVGSLTLSSGTTDFRLAKAFQPGGNSNDLVEVTHNLTLGGTLNVETQSGFTTGTYTLFDFGGTLSGSFSTITGLTGYQSQIVPSGTGELFLIVTSMGTVQFWDGNGAANDNIVSGGSGNWSATGNNWTNSGGSSNSNWQSGTAVFGGPGGTVTLTSPISAQVLIFNHGGYTLAGTQTLTMTGSAPAINVTNAGDLATIGVPIAGNSGLAIGGQGTVVLTNTANHFTGTTTVDGATLQIGNVTTAGSLGTGAVIVQNGGTLSLENLTGTAFANNVGGGLGGGTVLTTFLKNFTLSGALTDGAGPLSLDITLGGTIILTNPGNTYSGQTTVSQSTLQIGTATVAGSIGATSPVQVHQGGTLTLVNVAGNTLANAISNSGGNIGTVIVNSTNNLTLSGAITDTNGTGLGTIAFTQSGTGTTVLTNTDTYSGATNVTGGVLQIGNGASGNLTASNVTFSNSAILMLDQADGSSSNINVSLSASATTLQAIESGHLVLGGVISGLGAFDQNGSGTTELQVAQTYTGATNINAGTLQVDTSLAAGSTVHVGTSGTLSGAGTIAGNVTLTGNGNVDLTGGSIGGTFAVTGGNWIGTGTVNGLITSGLGTFTIGAGASLTASTGLNVTAGTLAGSGGTLSGNLTYTSGSNSTFGDVIAGTGTLTLNNAAATLDLTGTNTYNGLTTVSAGTLQVDGSLATGTTVNVLGAGVLSGSGTINGGVNVSGNGIINLGSTGQIDNSVAATGAQWNGQGTAGSVTSNSGVFALNGNLTTGVLTINAGTLTGNGTLNGGLAYHSTSSSTFGGSITTAISMAGNGATLNLTGANTVTGMVAVSAGTLQIGNGTSGSLSATSVSVTNSAILATNLANNATFTPDVNLGGVTSVLSAISTGTNTLSGVIGGVGFFNQKGAGTTILNNTETYTGSTNVSAGTLQIGDGTGGNLEGTSGVVVTGSGALALNLADNSTFTPTISLNAAGTSVKGVNTGTNTQTISGNISGLGTVNQIGTGTMILTGADTYTGATNVNAGTLEVDGTLASGTTVNVATAGTLTGFGTIGGKATLTGNGTINFTNAGTIAGTLAVTGGNWAGDGSVGQAVTVSAGTFTILNGGTLDDMAGVNATGGSLAGTGTLESTLNYTSNATSTFGGMIIDCGTSSSLTVNKTGGTLILTGNNTYTGATTISTGTLQLGDGTTAGATLGTGSVTVSGTGALALNLADGETFSQNVTVSAATATVKAIQAGTTTISSVISGLGGLTQSGTGTTILTTAQTYTGATTVTAGTLQVDSSLATASTANVSAVGTLSGIGTIPGTVNVLAGGAISPGDPSGPGTLTVGKLILNAGSNSDFRLAAPGTTGGGINDLVAVNGNLTIAGNLNITQLTGFGIGSYTLFTYGGALTNTGFSAINGTNGFAASVSTGTLHQVNLIVSGTAITQYWDGTGAANNSIITGGSGTWNNTTSNWTTSTGATNSSWLGGTAVFETTGGTVMLGTPINVQGLIFGATGYTLSGTSTLNLVGTPTTAPTVSVSAAGTTATISAPVTGISGLNASGFGTLILTNAANTYTGGTNVTNGFVQIGTTAAAGSIGGGTISIASGGTLTLINAHNNLLANNITNGVAATTGTLIINSTLANTLSGALTDGAAGTLALTQSGTGTTILTNASNNFSGATTISKGTLQIGTATAPGSLGSHTAVSVGAASTLSLVNVAGNLLSNNISNGASGSGLVSINSTTNFTLGGTLSNGTGTLALTKAGTGTTTLTGTDTYTGATTVSAGTLQIGDGTNGNLTATTAVTVSGTGALAMDLADTSAFNRNVNLSAAGANIKAIEIGTNTLSGVISGTGVVNQSGSGTTILSGTNTYTGATNVTTGTLDVTGSLAAGSTVNVATAGTLAGTGIIHGKATLTGSGAIDFASGGTIAGTLAVTGGNWDNAGTVTGLVTSSSGTFTLGTAANLTATAGLALTGGTLAGTGTLTGSLTDTSSSNDTFGGVIAGAAATVTMNKASTTLTLTGMNTYGGATNVTAGTLQIGDGTIAGASLGSGSITTAAAGTLTTDLANGETFAKNVTDTGHIIATGTTNNYTVSGIVSGTGNFTKTGANTVTVTAANTYKGGTAVSAGTLLVNNTTGSGTGSGVVTVNNTATLGGKGTIVGAVTLNSGGIIAPGVGMPGTAGTTLHATSLMWNGGGTLQLQLGSTGDELVLTGALTKGTAGTYTLDLTDATITQTSYTLATFASTTFAQSNFTLELPVGDTGTLVETSTSLMLTMLHVEEPAGGATTPTPPVPGIPGASFSSFSPSSDSPASSELSLTPTPEPTSAALLAFGSVALLGWRQRRRVA